MPTINRFAIFSLLVLSLFATGTSGQDLIPADAPFDPVEQPAPEQPADFNDFLDSGSPPEAAEEPLDPDPVTPPAPVTAEVDSPQEVAALEAEAANAEATEPEPMEVELPAEAAAGDGAIDWAGLIERAPEFFSVTHNAAVHLPIALWLFGAFFVLVGLVWPSWRTQIPLACLIGGTVTAVAAVLSGWWVAEYEYGNDWREVDWEDHLVKHRWAAVASLGVSVALSLMALVNQFKRNRGVGFVWRAGLLGLAIAVGWIGHIGGEVMKGEGFLEEAFEAWVNPDGE